MSKIKGFYSAVDKAAQALTRGKGTGKEFMVEVAKTKGVKPTEIKERKLQSIADLPKMSKDEFIKELEKSPAPTLNETVLGELDDKAKFKEYQRIAEEEYGRPYGELDHDEQVHVEGFVDSDNARYSEYKTEGGQNYREILMKLPSMSEKEQARMMALEAEHRRKPRGAQYAFEASPEGQEMKALQEKYKKDQFRSGHWDEPNVLAHMRVQDRVVPTYTKTQIEDIGKRMAETLGVDTKSLGSGAPSVAVQRGVITPLEAAQFSHAKGFQNVDTTGATQKVLHVEEIQSDWHQLGREKGYKEPQKPAVRTEANPFAFDSIQDTRAVPDAPFKKNWHELAMKRLLNYAAENGYDKIAVTPGAEQAKRFDLSKQVDELLYQKNEDGTYRLTAKVKGDNHLIGSSLNDTQLEEHVGKDVAQKIIGGSGREIKNTHYSTGSELPSDYALTGVDLEVGGEGMKGFYDKMIPSYLNEFGKKYNVQVSPFDIEQPSANLDATEVIMQNTPLHGFDITPQMREEITTQGLPMFADGGAVTASVGGQYDTQPDMRDGGNVIQGTAFKKGGKVTVSNNPDAMLMDMHDKKFGKGGALKKAIKGAQEILPSAQREENLRKMLDSSKIKERLYHATPKSFSEFKPGGADPTVSGKAIWMSTDPERQPAAHNIHNYFGSDPYKEGVNVMPLHVQATNPLVLDDPTMIEWAREVFAGGSKEFPELMAPNWVDQVRKEGYDSIQFADPYDLGDPHEIIMFEPNKIKSAIGNRGTYDTTDPDITKHNGGLAQIQRK
jgi:hypothetical protein